MRAETGSSRPSVWDDRPRIDKAGQNRRSDGWKSDVYCQPRQTSLDFEEWMKTSSGFDMFVTPIRRSIVAEKASMRMAVLPQFSKNCIVSQDYRNVVHELLKELEG